MRTKPALPFARRAFSTILSSIPTRIQTQNTPSSRASTSSRFSTARSNHVFEWRQGAQNIYHYDSFLRGQLCLIGSSREPGKGVIVAPSMQTLRGVRILFFGAHLG